MGPCVPLIFVAYCIVRVGVGEKPKYVSMIAHRLCAVEL